MDLPSLNRLLQILADSWCGKPALVGIAIQIGPLKAVSERAL